MGDDEHANFGAVQGEVEGEKSNNFYERKNTKYCMFGNTVCEVSIFTCGEADRSSRGQLFF